MAVIRRRSAPAILPRRWSSPVKLAWVGAYGRVSGISTSLKLYQGFRSIVPGVAYSGHMGAHAQDHSLKGNFTWHFCKRRVRRTFKRPRFKTGFDPTKTFHGLTINTVGSGSLWHAQLAPCRIDPRPLGDVGWMVGLL
jgi:hypothetical protein